MNIIKIAIIGLFLVSINATAQYGSNYGGGYGGSRNNGIPQTKDSKPTPEEIEKERNAKIDKIMERLKTELTLDDLQFIAIRNEIITNSKSTDILMKKNEISEEDKAKELKALQEKTEKTIISYLNKTQKDKYQLLKEERAVGKEDKKKKKNKEKEQQPE